MSAACSTAKAEGENAAKMGEYFLEHLVEINSPHIKEVRGRGLMIGVELKPEAGGARRFCEALQQSGILAEARRREHYEKPSVKRKRKEAKRKKNARASQG